MYGFDKPFIDAVKMIQEGKKSFVKTFVKEEAIAESMNDFVDTQTEYTNKAIKNSFDTMGKLGLEGYKFANEMGKFDYTNYVTDFWKSFAELNKKYQGSK